MEPLSHLVEAVFLLSLSMYPIGLMLGSECCCGGGIPVDCFGDRLEPRCLVGPITGTSSGSNSGGSPGFVNFSDRFLSRQPSLDFHLREPERRGVVPDSTSFSAYITHSFRSLQQLSYGEYVEYSATPKLNGRSYPDPRDEPDGIAYHRNAPVTLSPGDPSIVVRGWDWHFYPDTGEAASPFEQTQGFSQTHFSASTYTDSSNRTANKSRNAPLGFSVVGLSISGSAAVELTVSQLIDAVTFTVGPDLDFQVSVSLPKAAFNHSQVGVITWTVRVYKGIAYRDRTLRLEVSSSDAVDPPPPAVPLVGEGVYLVPLYLTPPQPQPPDDYYEDSGARFVAYDRGGNPVEGPQRVLVSASQSTVDLVTELVFEVEQSSVNLIPGRLTQPPNMLPTVRTVGDLIYEEGSYWVILLSPGSRPSRYTEKDPAKVAAFIAGNEILSFPGSTSPDWGAVQPTAFCGQPRLSLPYQLFPQTVTMSREDGTRVVQDRCGFMQETSVTLDYMGGGTYANYDYSDFDVLTEVLIVGDAVPFLYGFNEIPSEVKLPSSNNPALEAKTASVQPKTLDTPYAAYPEENVAVKGYAGFHPPKTVKVTLGEATFEYYLEDEFHYAQSAWRPRQAPFSGHPPPGLEGEGGYVYYEYYGPGEVWQGNDPQCPPFFGEGVRFCGYDSRLRDGFGGSPNPHKEIFKEEIEKQILRFAGEYEFTLEVAGINDSLAVWGYKTSDSDVSMELRLECDLTSGVSEFTLSLPAVSLFGRGYVDSTPDQSYPWPGSDEYSPYLVWAYSGANSYTFEPADLVDLEIESVPTFYFPAKRRDRAVNVTIDNLIAPRFVAGETPTLNSQVYSGGTQYWIEFSISRELAPPVNPSLDPEYKQEILETYNAIYSFESSQDGETWTDTGWPVYEDYESLYQWYVGSIYHGYPARSPGFSSPPTGLYRIKRSQGGFVAYSAILSVGGLPVTGGEIAVNAQDYLSRAVVLGALRTLTELQYDPDNMTEYEFIGYNYSGGQYRRRLTVVQRYPPDTVTHAHGFYRWKIEVPVSISYGEELELCGETAAVTSYGPGPMGDYPVTQDTDKGLCSNFSILLERSSNYPSYSIPYNPFYSQNPVTYDGEVHSFGGEYESTGAGYGSSTFTVAADREVFLINKTGAPVGATSTRLGSVRVKGGGTSQYTATVQYEGNAWVNECKTNKENKDRIAEGDKCVVDSSDGLCRQPIYDPEDLYYDYDFFDTVRSFKAATPTHEIHGLAPDGSTVGLIVRRKQDSFSYTASSSISGVNDEAAETTTASGGAFSFSWTGEGEGDYYFYVYAIGSASGTTTRLPAGYGGSVGGTYIVGVPYDERRFTYHECNPASSCEKWADAFAGRLSVTSTAELPESYGISDPGGELVAVEGGYLTNKPVTLRASGLHRTSSVRAYVRWRDASTGISLTGPVNVPMNEVSPVNIQMNPQDLEGFAIRPEIECYDEVGNRITGTTDDLVRFDVTPPELLSVNVNGAAPSGSTIILNFAENQLPLVFSGVTDPGATVEILESTGQPVPGATAVAAGRETVQGQEGTGEFSISASTSIPANSQQRYQIRMVDVAGNTATNSYYISNHPPNRYYSRLFLGSSGSARVLVYYTNVQQGSYGRITIHENGQATDYRDILVTDDYRSTTFEFNAQGFWHQITPTVSSESDVVTISRDEDLTKFGPGWEVLSELKASAGTEVRAVSVADAFVDYFATPVQSSSYASVVITRSQDIETLLDYLENADGGVFALSSISLVDGLWETEGGGRLLEINDEFADYEVMPIQSSETDTIVANVPLSEAQAEGIGPGWYVGSSLVLTGTPAVAIQGIQVQSISEAVDSDGVVIGTEIRFDSPVNATSGATIVLRKYFGYRLQFDKNVTAAQGQQMTLRGFTGFEVTFSGTVSATQGEPIALMTNAAISLHTELYLFNGYQTLEETFGVLYS